MSRDSPGVPSRLEFPCSAPKGLTTSVNPYAPATLRSSRRDFPLPAIRRRQRRECQVRSSTRPTARSTYAWTPGPVWLNRPYGRKIIDGFISRAKYESERSGHRGLSGAGADRQQMVRNRLEACASDHLFARQSRTALSIRATILLSAGDSRRARPG
jgi:hypothetical protein